MLTHRAFWFLRHGETAWNADGLAQGNVDVPLNDRGVAQAREAAAVLLGQGVRSVVSSPLGRARHTAGIVADALGLSVETEAELREVAFGTKEGQPMGPWYEDWLEGRSTPPDAESFAALRARAVRAVNGALQRPSPVLVVAHGSLFRAVRAEMSLPATVRTPNGLPIFCEPGQAPGHPWRLSAASGDLDAATANADP